MNENTHGATYIVVYLFHLRMDWNGTGRGGASVSINAENGAGPEDAYVNRTNPKYDSGWRRGEVTVTTNKDWLTLLTYTPILGVPHGWVGKAHIKLEIYAAEWEVTNGGKTLKNRWQYD